MENQNFLSEKVRVKCPIDNFVFEAECEESIVCPKCSTVFTWKFMRMIWTNDQLSQPILEIEHNDYVKESAEMYLKKRIVLTAEMQAELSLVLELRLSELFDPNYACASITNRLVRIRNTMNIVKVLCNSQINNTSKILESQSINWVYKHYHLLLDEFVKNGGHLGCKHHVKIGQFCSYCAIERIEHSNIISSTSNLGVN